MNVNGSDWLPCEDFWEGDRARTQFRQVCLERVEGEDRGIIVVIDRYYETVFRFVRVGCGDKKEGVGAHSFLLDFVFENYTFGLLFLHII